MSEATVSLYDELGGSAAIDAALDVFYEKVMSDRRVSVFFEDADVARVKAKQKAFLTIAFGGEADYDGRDLRAAHRTTVENGLNAELFDVFMGHFRDTLDELGVAGSHVEQVMAIAYGGKEEVLNR